jgi:DNA processing protein
MGFTVPGPADPRPAVSGAGQRVFWVLDTPAAKRTSPGPRPFLEWTGIGAPRPDHLEGLLPDALELLTLALLPDVGPRTVLELVARAPLADLVAHPRDHSDILRPRAVHALENGQARRRAEDEWKRALAGGAAIVGLSDDSYPDFLRHAYDPPPVLYVKGKLKADEGSSSVGIVGCRNASPQGAALARCLARDLADAGATIVSGLARGIDTSAHLGALDARGRTVAVLGSALDRLYPRENARLADDLCERGALVSEFPLGTGPSAGQFPRRNRILAAWGRGVVVVEAARRSGALVTARHALDEGREVLAVPGHPSHSGAWGTNQLIVDGATLVRDAGDVARALGWELPEGGPEPDGDELLAALRPGAPTSLEEIEARCPRPTAEILARLGELELVEKVRRLPGPLFVRA